MNRTNTTTEQPHRRRGANVFRALGLTVFLAGSALFLSGCATMAAVQSLGVSSGIVTGHIERENADFTALNLKVGGFLSSWEVLHIIQAKSLVSQRYSYALAFEANEVSPISYEKLVFYVDGKRTDWTLPTGMIAPVPESYVVGTAVYWKYQQSFIAADAGTDGRAAVSLAQALAAGSDVTMKAYHARSDLSLDYKFTKEDAALLTKWLDATQAAEAAKSAAVVLVKDYAPISWPKLWAPAFASDNNKKDFKIDAIWLGMATTTMHTSATLSPYNNGRWVEVGATFPGDTKNAQVGQYNNQSWAFWVPKTDVDPLFDLKVGQLVTIYGTAWTVGTGALQSLVLEVDKVEIK